MNRAIIMGRLTRDVDLRETPSGMQVARYTLAVDRRRSKDADPSQQTADFISCVAFGRSAEFADKYFHKGMRVLVEGHIQTGSYDHKDGYKVYTTDVIVDSQEFADSKVSGDAPQTAARPSTDSFNNIPAGSVDELPFA